MRRMTSEIIRNLQTLMDQHGDLPFEIHDPDNGVVYTDIAVKSYSNDENTSEIKAIGLAI